jgi:hypothetical protein
LLSLDKELLGMLLKNPLKITEIITYVKNANSIISDEDKRETHHVTFVEVQTNKSFTYLARSKL